MAEAMHSYQGGSWTEWYSVSINRGFQTMKNLFLVPQLADCYRPEMWKWIAIQCQAAELESIFEEKSDAMIYFWAASFEIKRQPKN